MNVDIDNFIREQKSKIATERQYLSNQNISKSGSDPDLKNSKFSVKYNEKNNNNDYHSEENFIFKMKEGELMKNKFKQELKDDLSNSNELNKYLELSPRKEKVMETDIGNGLLPGLGYSNSASKKKQQIRNQEYNEFKKIDEIKFKNRFNDKKNLSRYNLQDDSNLPFNISSQPTDLIKSNNMVPVVFQPKPQFDTVQNKDPKRVFESKLDVLEKKVEDLRNFRIHDINISQFEADPIISNQKALERPNIGHLKSYHDTENQLNEIEKLYDSSRSKMIKNFKSVNPKKVQLILDDEAILEQDSMTSNKVFLSGSPLDSRNNPTNANLSIIPLGRTDEDSLKRRKQEQYRRELDNQMKEKSNRKSSRSNDNSPRSDQNVSFFDKFGSDSTASGRIIGGSRVNTQSSIPVADRDNEYLYYASRNPLDDYETAGYIPSSHVIQSADAKGINSSALSIGVRTESQRVNAQYQKESYGEELKKQIEERKIQKELDRKKFEEYEKRKNEEIMNYDPFGRGGGGAPLKDNRGETISDLKNIRFDGIPGRNSRNNNLNNQTIVSSAPLSFRTRPVSDRQQDGMQTDTVELKMFARGGHGIFGQALSDEDKLKAERYKDELQEQIDRKRQQKEIEKENEKIRESKEREKFEREQKQIQLELENERKMQQQKETERLQKLEEIRIAAKEKQTKKPVESVVEALPENLEPNVRSSPIPTYNTRRSPRPRTPQVIRQQTTPVPERTRRQSSDIVFKLHELKQEIISKSKLLEKEIVAGQQQEVNIFDPRLLKTNQVPQTADYNANVFQSVLNNKGPLSVRRGLLRPKQSVSKSDLRPDTEAYLDEHLKRQERVLERIEQTGFDPFQMHLRKMVGPDFETRPSSTMSNQLESETNFITFNQSREFPIHSNMANQFDNDFRFPRNQSPYKVDIETGSNASLNIDELTRKNKARLRKLQKSQFNNERNQSPEDILNGITAMENYDSYSFTGR